MQGIDSERLAHMLEAARKAVEYTRGKPRNDLDIIWEITRSDLPALMGALEPAVPPEQD